MIAISSTPLYISMILGITQEVQKTVFMNELQNAWNWNAAMDLNSRRIDTK